MAQWQASIPSYDDIDSIDDQYDVLVASNIIIMIFLLWW